MNGGYFFHKEICWNAKVLNFSAASQMYQPFPYDNA